MSASSATVPDPYRAVPLPSDTTRPYWDAALQGHLSIQQCRQCESYQHPPAPICQRCRSTSLSWSTVSGKGRLFEVTVVRETRMRGLGDHPYVCAAVELVEQTKLIVLTNLVGLEPGQSPVIGMALEVCFETIRDGIVLPQFRPMAQ